MKLTHGGMRCFYYDTYTTEANLNEITYDVLAKLEFLAVYSHSTKCQKYKWLQFAASMQFQTDQM